MTDITRALFRRDDLAVRKRQGAKRPKPSSLVGMTMALVVTWLAACSLSLAISFGSVG